ncbi:MAG: hypothetical protein JJE36_04525 [Coriobacteriia bacterium]|nr:hypothetical protein [Coriobacteriia bacterium]
MSTTDGASTNSTSSIETLIHSDAVERLSERDASLFSHDPLIIEAISERLGWVMLASDTDNVLDFLYELRRETEAAHITDVVLLGMGGSSLATRVLSDVLEHPDVRLHVLDTTCAEDVKRLIGLLDFKKTFFIVSSKSGSTVEPITLGELFFHTVAHELGVAEAAEHFFAVTDKDTPLSRTAEAQKWRHVVHARKSVGGRFSALSMFGLVPAALAGIDFKRLIDSAIRMETLCRGEETFANPGAHLASFLNDCLQEGRNKLMLVLPRRYRPFGMWLEQLVAESLGKDGRGIIPIVTSKNRVGSSIHSDQCVVILHESDDEELVAYTEEIEQLGPVAEFIIDNPYEIGGEFIRWEFAVALVGFLMGVNPFDQPDVASSKTMTNALLQGEKFDVEPSSISELADLIAPGDYIAILSYLPEWAASHTALVESAACLEEKFSVPTIIARGPRYLHSTGQLYKGGPNTGVFIVLGDDDNTCDIELEGKPFTLRELNNAQRKGDIISLLERGRRVISARNLSEIVDYCGTLSR